MAFQQPDIDQQQQQHDTDPYERPVPCTLSSLLCEHPKVTYPNPSSLLVKVLLFVGPQHFEEISSRAQFDKNRYAPRISPGHPEIVVNSVIEICGSVKDIKQRRYGRIVHRVVWDNIYHLVPRPDLTTCGDGQAATSNRLLSDLKDGSRLITSDDVMLLLINHWVAAREYYLGAGLAHRSQYSMISYYNIVPSAHYLSTRGQPADQYGVICGVLGIVSSVTPQQITLLLPVPMHQGQDGLTTFAAPSHSFGVSNLTHQTLPLCGSLCLVLFAHHSHQWFYAGYLPLITAQQSSGPNANAGTMSFTREMFLASCFMTNKVQNEILYKLITHHKKLQNNITTKGYTSHNPPPSGECIDVHVYLDIAQGKAATDQL